jgi:enterochelin esterase-like enzyme
VVGNGLVIVQAGGDDGALVGLEAETGALRWRTFQDAHYAQSPIVTELAGRRQIVAIGSTRIAGIDPQDGKELWSHEHGGAGEFGAESASPLPVGGDRLFVKHDNERSSVLQIAVRDDESFGVEVLGENRTMTRSYAPPTVWDGSVYGYTSRFLSALDLETGEELWRSRAPGDGFPIAVEGLLFVATKNEGTAHLGWASPDGWAELDHVALFEDLVWTPPSYADGAFYIRSLTEMARVDLVRIQAGPTERQTSDLPPELQKMRQRIDQGGDAHAAVAALLRDLDGPLVSGERVLFLWHGEAEEVGIAGDMFGFRYDESMRRLEGTDLWWHQLELDRRGRFNYAYFPDYEPALDPLNPRTVESTAMGPDLNHRAEDALQMSWFAMPEWPGKDASEASRSAPSHTESGRLERFDVAVEIPPQERGPAGPQEAQTVTVPVTVWLPPGYNTGAERYPMVFSLERYAIRLGDWPGTLDAVVGDRVAPLIGVMIDAPDGFYGRRGGGSVGLLVPQIVAEVDRRYRTFAQPEERAVVGALYTGPPALRLARGEERLFGRVAVQSPFVIDVMMPMYRQMIAREAATSRPTAFYFEWAHWEMRSRLEGLVLGDFMRELYEFFAGEGYDVIGGEVWDSTDWAGWRNRTGLILEALFPSGSGNARVGLGPWLVEPGE